MKNRRKPFTLRERRSICYGDFGRRPVNDWGEGDLPAPWCPGDVVHLRDDEPLDREFVDRLDLSIRGRTWWTREDGEIVRRPGYFVVSVAYSIDDGDGWYFRVRDGESDFASDRMHVAWKDRCERGWERDFNYMAPFELIETADPEGLALRERMLAEGWSYQP